MVLPTVALLPGLLLDWRLWRHQIGALADLARPFVPDLGLQDSMTGLAESVLAALPERFALAGLSMGGYVALEIVRLAPQRVARLALLDTKAEPDSAEQTARRLGLMELAEKGRFHGVTPQLLPLLLGRRAQGDEALRAEVLAMAETVGRAGFLRQQRAIVGRQDFRSLLPGIAVPTLVLCGEEDALTPPAQHAAMAAAIPGAHLTIVPGAGHLPPLEAPLAVTAALRDWLSWPTAACV